MADETTTEAMPIADEAHHFDAPEPMTATQRLRAFEDETLGADAVRINGRVERGSGSFFQTKLTDEQRAHHGALEKLIAAEQKLADANTAAAVAQSEYEAAEKACDE